MNRIATCAAVFLAVCAMSGESRAKDNDWDVIYDACWASFDVCIAACSLSDGPISAALFVILCKRECNTQHDRCIDPLYERGGGPAMPTQRGTGEPQVDPTPPRPRPRRPAPSTLPDTMSR